MYRSADLVCSPNTDQNLDDLHLVCGEGSIDLCIDQLCGKACGCCIHSGCPLLDASVGDKRLVAVSTVEGDGWSKTESVTV
jgi:hypothetical protein